MNDAQKAERMSLAMERLAGEYREESHPLIADQVDLALNQLSDSILTRLFNILQEA